VFARTVCCAPVDVLKTDREREITFSAREEEGEECIRKETLDCARAFRHSRERRRDASIQCAEIPRWSSKQRERERNHFKKKTYRARFASSSSSSSERRRWRWFRDDDARCCCCCCCCCCCYSSASRENSSALLAEFRWSFFVSQEQISETDVHALVVRKNAGNACARGFFCLLDRTFRDGSRLVSSRSVRLFSLLLSAGWESDEWRIVSFGSAAGSFIFSREFN